MEDMGHEEEIVKPAISGTLAIMKAAKIHGIKRVVITSSIAACIMSDDPTKTHFTDQDWSDSNLCPPFFKSKTLAERYAWDYLKQLSKKDKFELTTILPGFLIGPNIN